MQNAVSLGVYTHDSSVLSDAMERALSVITFSDGPGQDGIHRDGSFLQHNGLIYQGNVGGLFVLPIARADPLDAPGSTAKTRSVALAAWSQPSEPSTD